MSTSWKTQTQLLLLERGLLDAAKLYLPVVRRLTHYDVGMSTELLLRDLSFLSMTRKWGFYPGLLSRKWTRGPDPFSTYSGSFTPKHNYNRWCKMGSLKFRRLPICGDEPSNVLSLLLTKCRTRLPIKCL